MRRTRIARGIAALGLVAAIGGACSSESDGDASGGLTSGGDYSVAGAVAEIPAEVVGDGILIYTGDLTAATEASGLERPDTFDDVYDWLLELTARDSGGPEADPEVYVPLGELTATGFQMRQFEEYDAEVGWSILDVEAFV